MLVSDCRELSKIYYSSQTKGALGDCQLFLAVSFYHLSSPLSLSLFG